MKLLERDHALGAIAAVLRGARAGSGSALFIVGEAGLGKTALVTVACDAARREMDVAQGRGEPMEQAVAFGLAGQVLQSVGAGGLVVVGPGPLAEPTVPFHRVLRWLEGRSGRPLLIAVDDLHWADADSLSLLGFVARRLARLPVAMICALRPWPEDTHGLARALQGSGEARIERLAPLTEASTGVLMSTRCGVGVPADTRRLAFQMTGGNPLLAEQLAGALARGEWTPEAGQPALDALGEKLLLSRFAGLDESGLATIRAGSVLGTSWHPEIACEVAGIDESTIDVTLDGLVRSGLVSDAGEGRVRFAHPLFGQALYDDLSSPLRRRLHARAFRALSARGLDGEASQHAEHAALYGDREAVAVLERAGRAALAAGATITAVRNLEAAVRFAGSRAPVGLLRALAEALSACGRAADAARVCDRLLGEADLGWAERIEVLRTQGRALYMTAARDRGEAAFTEAATLAERHDRRRAVQPLVDLSLAVWIADGPGRALPIAARARRLSAGSGLDDVRARADATWGHIALETGDPRGPEATEPVGRSLEGPGARALLDPVELAWPWAPVFQHAMNCNYLDRHDEAEAIFRRAYDVLDRAGAANASATVAIHIANAAIRGGRLHAALEASERAVALADLTPGVRGYAHLARADALAWLGRFDECEHECRQVEALARDEWFVRLWMAHVRGMRLLWQGDGAADAVLGEAEDITRQVGIREPCHMHWWNHAVAAYLAGGAVDRAETLVGWAEELAGPLPCRWPRIVASFGRAQLAERLGREEEAEVAFREALDLHAQVGFPLEHVEALLAYGGFLRRRGRLEGARSLLGEALRGAEALGAASLARIAREEFRLAGGRRRRRADDPRQLTPAQMRVAALAAEGLTNDEIARRLYVSVNTVEAHLRQVFQKLQVRSRRDLILRWREDEIR